ncbi:hypothetical protein FSP39_004447 [Pinctada imbricata]|uniref:Uncharacterized protein n=1 Tax=Pinctada imbricata TaxID=66713 RepID=A0AA89CDR8_PINIB|nr:hypothetical protein FSP39_004447 [Pinctada imbricata]
MLESIISENLFQRLIIFVDCSSKIKHDPEKKSEFRETVVPDFLREQDIMFVDLKSKWSSHSNEKWRRRLMPKLINYDYNYTVIDDEDEPRRILGHKCPIQ